MCAYKIWKYGQDIPLSHLGIFTIIIPYFYLSAILLRVNYIKGFSPLTDRINRMIIEVEDFSCLNEECPDYNKKGAANIIVHSTYGKHARIRMLKCKTCGSFFSERKDTLFYNCRLSEEQITEIFNLLGRGYSIRKIHRLTGISRNAISRLAHVAERYINQCIECHFKEIENDIIIEINRGKTGGI